MMKVMRTVALLSMLVVIIAGCQPAQLKQGGNESSSKELTIAIFGGSWGDAIKENIVKPFEKEHGVKVNLVEGTSTVTISKLKQEKNSPTIDIALMDSGISELSFHEGLVEVLDASKLTNAKDLIPLGLQKSGDKPYGVVLGYWGLGIAYNPTKVKEAPTSWLDLWKSEYQNKVTIPTPETTGGLPLLQKMAELNGGSTDKINKGFEKIKSLNTVAYFNGSGAASNLFQSGEVIIGAHYGGPVWALKDQGVPIEFIIPKEGVLGAGSYWHLVKGSSKKELAMKFLDKAISVDAQKGIADQLYLAPVNKKVKLSEETASKMPYGKNGSIDDIVFPNYEEINKYRNAWNDQWNKEIGKK
ncbi:putative spermidine/putrescine transport system substrate-binding protein [Seinonella peptonophila]|uniref:Putative spermidine/putrescine transport system substrate-binding protein n=1 Tax=Seinonella peptonophila TaxID=112248 RepID=A0A1M5BJQ9_9BACL|nr:ABC transporter substrate-binding protein [Seinonella peptonophila]SHF42814.1 putative spermidine/putrescine transport system substrate-binding protein [Seinonella peptonophila]